jgi:hypothetical protein
MSWLRVAAITVAIASLLAIDAGTRRVQFATRDAEAAQPTPTNRPPQPPPVSTQTQVPPLPLPTPTRRPVSPQH